MWACACCHIVSDAYYYGNKLCPKCTCEGFTHVSHEDATSRYQSRELILQRGTVEKTLSEAEIDTLLEEMEDLWWEMTPEDCQIAHDRAEEWLKIRGDIDE